MNTPLLSARELVDRLNESYISPLSKLYLDIEALKMVLFRQKNYIKIADPASWFISSEKIEVEFALLKLQSIYNYIQGNETVFNPKTTLEAGKSIPYFEWVQAEKTVAISDGLAGYQFLFINEDIEKENLSNGLATILKIPTASRVLFFFQTTGLSDQLVNLTHDTVLTKYHPPFIDAITQKKVNKLFRSRLQQPICVLVIDPNGKLEDMLTQNELQKKLESFLTEES